MEIEINIIGILKDKPNGTKLYTDAFGELILAGACSTTISTQTKAGSFRNFYTDGKYSTDGEPILVPSKEMRDWAKFAWERGDILVSNDGCINVIFDKWYDDTYTSFYGKHYLNREDENNIKYNKSFLCTTDKYSIEKYDISAQFYIDNIEKRLGGKINCKTLEIDKTQPKFKPFDKVLVRDSHDDTWKATFFSHIRETDGRYMCCCLNWKRCIPYEGNESLLGTNKDVEE